MAANRRSEQTKEGTAVEVKIGVQNAARELSLESSQTAEAVQKTVSAALEAGGVLTLEDDKGRKVLVPVAQLAYVEIGEPTVRKVGFGAT